MLTQLGQGVNLSRECKGTQDDGINRAFQVWEGEDEAKSITGNPHVYNTGNFTVHQKYTVPDTTQLPASCTSCSFHHLLKLTHSLVYYSQLSF